MIRQRQQAQQRTRDARSVTGPTAVPPGRPATTRRPPAGNSRSSAVALGVSSCGRNNTTSPISRPRRSSPCSDHPTQVRRHQDTHRSKRVTPLTSPTTPRSASYAAAPYPVHTTRIAAPPDAPSPFNHLRLIRTHGPAGRTGPMFHRAGWDRPYVPPGRPPRAGRTGRMLHGCGSFGGSW
jgi:hypothetical protein